MSNHPKILEILFRYNFTGDSRRNTPPRQVQIFTNIYTNKQSSRRTASIELSRDD